MKDDRLFYFLVFERRERLMLFLKEFIKLYSIVNLIVYRSI